MLLFTEYILRKINLVRKQWCMSTHILPCSGPYCPKDTWLVGIGNDRDQDPGHYLGRRCTRSHTHTCVTNPWCVYIVYTLHLSWALRTLTSYFHRHGSLYSGGTCNLLLNGVTQCDGTPTPTHWSVRSCSLVKWVTSNQRIFHKKQNISIIYINS